MGNWFIGKLPVQIATVFVKSLQIAGTNSRNKAFVLYLTLRYQTNGGEVKINGGWEISQNFNKRGVKINGGGWAFSQKINKQLKAGITRYDRTRVLWSTIFGGKFRAKNARVQA